MDLAEVAIIKAAFGVISRDPGMLRRFEEIRLTESLSQMSAFKSGWLVVAGFPVRPKDFPSQAQEIFVDLWICPVLPFEQTSSDSALEATTLFNDFRMLLNANLPLRDLEDENRHVCDAVLDLDYRRTVFPATGGLRIPNFVARYTAKIDVKTGDFAV